MAGSNEQELANLFDTNIERIRHCLEKISKDLNLDREEVAEFLSRHYLGLVNQLSVLEGLPPEIVQNIVLKLPVRDILNVCASSTTLMSFCKDEFLWKALAKQLLNRPGNFQDAKNYAKLEAADRILQTFREDSKTLSNKGQRKILNDRLANDYGRLYRLRNFQAIYDLSDLVADHSLGEPFRNLLNVMMEKRDWEGLTLLFLAHPLDQEHHIWVNAQTFLTGLIKNVLKGHDLKIYKPFSMWLVHTILPLYAVKYYRDEIHTTTYSLAIEHTAIRIVHLKQVFFNQDIVWKLTGYGQKEKRLLKTDILNWLSKNASTQNLERYIDEFSEQQEIQS